MFAVSFAYSYLNMTISRVPKTWFMFFKTYPIDSHARVRKLTKNAPQPDRYVLESLHGEKVAQSARAEAFLR